MQLARAVRNRTTGVLYVLDEPSIGLHPSNIDGLLHVMQELVSDGNSVVLVDHDVQVLRHADHFVELGPEAGANGGTIIAQGTLDDLAKSRASRIGGFLVGTAHVHVHEPAAAAELFARGEIVLETGQIHTVRPLRARFPQGRLSVVTGVSGSGKTTLVLESLIPALMAEIAGTPPPAHIRSISANGIRQVRLIDAVPIGANVRSTVATYANVHDELRKVYAQTAAAKAAGYKAGAFSYNTGKLRCPTCDGTGSIDLDVQFLPDVTIDCPDCGGTRYAAAAGEILREGTGGTYALPALMALSVDEARAACADLKTVRRRLDVLHDLGLGYLMLGEATPGLSGGEAQRLKLASEMGKGQEGSIFVFDEPTIGLHPLDVKTLLGVFERLLDRGATVIVIEHDLDVIRSADYILDMGPGGGTDGGRIVACGTRADIVQNPNSITGRYLG